ncbi:MAG: universal stress protein [Pseudomonadota bacterium]
MTAKLVVGLDGVGSGDRAVAFAKRLATLIGTCEIIVVYVIEWSPFTFQTAEENEVRHKRREEEIGVATARIIDPALDDLKAGGFTASGRVRHGDVSDTLKRIAKEEGAEQIIVARSSEGGFSARVFGSSTVNLVTSASVPVTVVA